MYKDSKTAGVTTAACFPLLAWTVTTRVTAFSG